MLLLRLVYVVPEYRHYNYTITQNICICHKINVVEFHTVSQFVLQQTEEQLRLLKYQRRLEEEKNRPYLDLSVHQTIYRLLLENEHKHAEQIRKDFKIPERR